MWCFLFNLLNVHSIFICIDKFHSLSNLILVWIFLKLNNYCTSVRGVVHLSKWYTSMLRLDVRVLLLFVKPSFVFIICSYLCVVPCPCVWCCYLLCVDVWMTWLSYAVSDNGRHLFRIGLPEWEFTWCKMNDFLRTCMALYPNQSCFPCVFLLHLEHRWYKFLTFNTSCSLVKFG
jgi:hypothetical protein